MKKRQNSLILNDEYIKDTYNLEKQFA